MVPITWFKVDDGFWSHPKVVELSREAIALWVLAGAYAAQHLTDGVIAVGQLRMLGAGRESADELVIANLWEQVDAKSWRFKGWDEYQPSRAEVEADRQAARDRMKKVRAAKRARSAERSGEPPANVRENFERSSEEVRSTPTRPDPTRPSPSNDGESVAAKRGSRLTAGWMPAQSTIDKIKADYPALDLKAEHEAFTDYWIAQPGQKGVKLDWDATWRNWMRNTAKRARPSKPTPTERAMQTAQAGRQVAGRLITSLDPKELT